MSVRSMLLSTGCLLLAATLIPSRGSTQTIPANLFREWHWRSIGPMRAGRTRSAAGVASQPFTFYAGVVNGGVWKTTDAGRTWLPIFDDQPTQSIGTVVVAPSNPDILYVGSGEGLQRPDLSVGDGIYKSTDAGKSWTHLGLRDGQQIPNIAVDPRNPDRLFVAVLGHPYGPNRERGIFRSLDGGRSFQPVLQVDENVGGNDVDIDPVNPDIVYATLWEARQGPWENAAWSGTGGGIFKSTDGGASWKKLTEGLPEVVQANLAIAPSNPRRLYATVAGGATGGGGRGGAGGTGFYRSDDAGATWTRITTDTRPVGRIGGGDLPVPIVHPKNADVIIMASTVSWKSEDGGKTWAPFKGAPGGEDYQGGWINPENPDIVFLVADQGATISLNGGATWSSWYNQSTAQLYHIAASSDFPYRLCSGQQESGSACVASRGNYGAISDRDWLPVGVDEYGYAAPDPLHPNLVFGGRSVTRFDYLTGLTSTVGPGRGGRGGGAAAGGPPVRSPRTQPVVFSQADRRALYYGGGNLWRTMDGGISWKQVSPNFTRDAWEPGASVGKYVEQAQSRQLAAIYTIAPSPIDTGRVWLGTDDGLIEVTANGGRTWRNVTPPQIGPFWKVFMIDAGHFDRRTAYAAVNTLRIDDMRPHLYRTHDDGATWTEIVNGMEGAGAANAIREDPKRPGLLYASTENGVFVSLDDGDHWSSLRINLPASSVRDLMVKDDDVAVATHGRGFWILDGAAATLRDMKAGVADQAAVLFKPGTAWRVRWNTSDDMPWPKEEPVSENPPDGVPIDYYLKETASGRVTLEVFTPAGRLVRRYASDDPLTPIPGPATAPVPLYWYRIPTRLSADAGLHRWIWDLHYQPSGTGGGRGGLPMGAIPHQGVPAPGTPLVNPGLYTVKLTVNGRSYTQPITVRQDPRVKTPAAAMQQIYGTIDAAQDVAVAVRSLTGLRDEATALTPGASGAAARALARFDSLAAALLGVSTGNPPAATEGRGGRGGGFGGFGGRGGAAAMPGSLLATSSALSGLANTLTGADATPTATQVAALTAGRREATAVLARWRMFRLTEVPTVNRALRAAGLKPIGAPR